DDLISKTLNNLLFSESLAVNHLHEQYKFSPWSINLFHYSLHSIKKTLQSNGKIVVSGIGKSYKLAKKMVATLSSFSINSAALHPVEALHGDLGVIKEGDALIVISSSGNSIEISQLLNHVDNEVKIILLTCQRNSKLERNEKVNSLIYAELPFSCKEENVYGINAPTISTTLLMILADCFSVCLFKSLTNDDDERKILFGNKHPGGAIGEAYN
ncbi:SIS domain-containing protein, partial [Ascoidea rubescens DSM 1968]